MGNCTSSWEKLCTDQSQRIELDDKIARFDNMEGKDIESMWRTFTKRSTEFNIEPKELIQIIMSIKDTIAGGISDPNEAKDEIKTATQKLIEHWKEYDNDTARLRQENGKYKIDAMELIMGFMFTSKMSLEDKVNFLFDCIDFDGDNDIDIGEFAISLRSIEAGLARMRCEKPCAERKIKELSKLWFTQCQDQNNPCKKATRHAFQRFCTNPKGPVLRIFEIYAEAEGDADADAVKTPGDNLMLGMEERTGGDEFMSIKPWLGAIVPPSKKQSIDSSTPESNLDLEWIHGYRSADCRKNVFYINEEDQDKTKTKIIFHAAAAAVVMQVDSKENDITQMNSKEQSFFLEHTDDILCLASTKYFYKKEENKEKQEAHMVATGQIGKQPKIELWDPKDCSPIKSLVGFHKKGIINLSFSHCDVKNKKNPQYLASVGLDDEHSIGIYNIDRESDQFGRLVYSSMGNRQKVLDITWNPFHYYSNNHKEKDSSKKVVQHSFESFVSCGVKHCDFWTITDKRLSCSKGLFDRQKPTILLSVIFLDEEHCVFGTVNGTLFVYKIEEGSGRWKCQTGSHEYKAHSLAVNILTALPSNESKTSQTEKIKHFLSGGKDGKIVIWQWNWHKEKTSQVPVALMEIDILALAISKDLKHLEILPKGVRAMAYRENKILVGTLGSEIFELKITEDLKTEDLKTEDLKDKGLLAKMYEEKVKCQENIKQNFEKESAGANPQNLPQHEKKRREKLKEAAKPTNINDKTELIFGKPLQEGHYKEELWGLAIYPNGGEYCTVGDDHTLRLWNLENRCMETVHDVEAISRACTYSPDGSQIAIGMGGGSRKNKKDGSFKIYTRALKGGKYSLELAYEAKDAKQWISDIKFSPNGKTLAIGSHDNCIYLYSVLQNFKRQAKFNKHNSYITHFDFSNDSKYLQSTCGAYELLFSDTLTGKQITSATDMRDVNWSTWTCTLGWPVQGIWPACADGTDVNAVDRQDDLIVTADDFGKVKIFRYPCVKKKSLFHEFKGHSSHVTNIRWTPPLNGKSYAISTGGNDRCVFQWKHSLPLKHDDEGGKRSNSNTNQDEFHLDFQANTKNDDEEEDDLLKFDEVRSGGDEFMAVKPWIGAIVAPKDPAKHKVQELQRDLEAASRNMMRRQRSVRDKKRRKCEIRPSKDIEDSEKEEKSYNQNLEALSGDLQKVNELVQRINRGTNSSAPDDNDLELEWIHGYRCFDARNNLFYNKDDKFVYHAAAVGIVLEPNRDNPEPEPVQRHQIVHQDDILSIAMHVTQNVVATGDVGKTPVIQVWDIDTFEVKATLTGFHQRAITLLKFSPDGSLIASVGQDDNHSIALYDWKSRSLRASTKGDRNKTLGLHMFGNDTLFTCGVKHIKFWVKQGRNISSKSAPTGKEGKKDTFTSCAELDKYKVCGSASGTLFVFEYDEKKNDVTIKGAIKEHTSVIYAMSNTDDKKKLITGGKDGKVFIWKLNEDNKIVVECIFNLDLPQTEKARCNSFMPTIRSVCLSKNKSKLLIGTMGSEVFEIENINVDENFSITVDQNKWTAKKYMDGHYKDEIWGLAVHPTKREYCTVGDDKTIRIWSIEKRKSKGFHKLDGMARACAYHPNGEVIAVGLGGSVGRGRSKIDGTVAVYNIIQNEKTEFDNKFEKLVTCHDAKQWISDIKYSGDGKTLAVGSHDNNIYIYSVDHNYKKRACFNKHNSYITHFDFSKDGSYLQSNCGAYELLFCDVSTGQHITSATDMCHTHWDTWTCTLGWPVQGIWPPLADGTDINATSRSHSGSLIATVDDFGKVKLFRYPCVAKNARYLEFSGHSSHVTNVRWTAYDECLISVGGNDRCIFQWYNNANDDNDILKNDDNSSAKKDGNGENELEDEDEDLFFSEDRSGGDEFMAVKPWLGQIKAPSNHKGDNPRAPDVELQLEWVYGYSGHTFRENLFYSYTEDVIYPAAALGVIMKVQRESEEDADKKSNLFDEDEEENKEQNSVPRQQRFYNGHTDDIISLAIDNDRRYVATGQRGKCPPIHIWDVISCTRACSLEAFHRRGVLLLAFSHDGKKLASVGQDDEHSMAVWKDVGGSWSKVLKEATGKADNNIVLFCEWLKIDKGEKSSEFELVTGGKKHIRFWKFSGTNLTSKKGIFGKIGKIQTLLCAVNLKTKDGWKLVTGTKDGELYVWNGKNRECESARQGHDQKAINCMKSMGDEDKYSLLVTGGADGKIKLWNSFLENIGEFDLAGRRGLSYNPSVRGIDIWPSWEVDTTELKTRILVGTQGSEIFEIFIKTREKTTDYSYVVLNQGHWKGELWGLAVNENERVFASTGDDGTICIWDREKNELIKRCNITKKEDANNNIVKSNSKKNHEIMSRAVAWNEDGDMLLVGLGGDLARGGKDRNRDRKGGHMLFLYIDKELIQIHDSTSDEKFNALEKEWISDVKFAPTQRNSRSNPMYDNKYAVGSHDNNVYLYGYFFVEEGERDNNKKGRKLKVEHLATIKGHSSFITHFDFSSNGDYMISNCGAYNLLFWELTDNVLDEAKEKGKVITKSYSASKSRSEEWNTWTSTLGWPVQGIWINGADGTDINAVDRSLDGDFLIVTTDSGDIRLYHYPCISNNAAFVRGLGHSSHVTNGRFIYDYESKSKKKRPEGIITTGGNDKCLFQWKLQSK